jgi:hypothetical protein
LQVAEKKRGASTRLYPWTLVARLIRYSVVPALKSSDTAPVEETKSPCAVARTMNAPEELVVPCPEMLFAEGFIWADPDETVYVFPFTAMLPLLSESVYPSARLPVTVKVRVPEAVPFSLGSPTTWYTPCVLVSAMVWPTDTFTLV